MVQIISAESGQEVVASQVGFPGPVDGDMPSEDDDHRKSQIQIHARGQ
jgi:hypothetical protein